MKIIAITQKGSAKAENEDRIIVGKDIIAEGIYETELTGGIVAVADGVGGNNAGAVASQFVAERLTALEDISKQVFVEINEGLLQLSFSQADYNNMATTLSGIAFCGEETWLFSIGNTRVYLLQSQKYLKQLTSDDTTLNYLRSIGRISDEEAETFDRKNEIIACFGGGMASLFNIKCDEIDAVVGPFIMTSDGIHDYVSLDQMEDIIEEYGVTVAASEALIAAAREGGSFDDISIILGVV